MGLAQGRMWQGDYKGAIALSEHYLELNPSDANTYNMLSVTRLGSGTFKPRCPLSVPSTSIPTSETPTTPRGRSISGLGCMTTHSPTRRPTGELRPEVHAARVYRAVTFLMRDEPDRARQEVEADPLVGPLMRATAFGYRHLVEGRFRESSEAAFREALAAAEEARRKADPAATTGIGELRDTHFTLGRMLVVEGRTREAVRAFESGEAISAEG